MASKSYGPRRFKREYVEACIEAGVPLDPVQESLLEQTLTNAMKSMKGQREALDNQLMDRDVLIGVCESLGENLNFWPTRIINIVRDYKTNQTRLF